MKALIALFVIWACAVWAVPTAPTNSPYSRSVSADSDGNLLWPTNLITVACIGGYRNATYWYLDYADVFRAYSTASLVVTNGDLITSYCTPLPLYVDKQMTLFVVRGFPADGDIAWSVSPTNYASIDVAGKLTMLAAGDVTVAATLGGQTKSVRITLESSNPGQAVSTTILDSESARYIANTNIAAMISGGTAVWHRTHWATIDHAATNYVQDTQCWARAVDLSGVVVSTGGSTPYWHGTLVTSQHIAMAKHAYNGIGTSKRFVGVSGSNYVRSITAILDPWPGQSWRLGDIVFGRLSSALPTNDVAVYSVLPANYTNYFVNGVQGMSAMMYDQLGRCLVADLGNVHSHSAPTDSSRAQFYSTPYIGDSGRPVFMLLPGRRPILLYVLTYANSGTGFVSARAAVDAVLAADGAALTDADLTGLKEYLP